MNTTEKKQIILICILSIVLLTCLILVVYRITSASIQKKYEEKYIVSSDTYIGTYYFNNNQLNTGKILSVDQYAGSDFESDEFAIWDQKNNDTILVKGTFKQVDNYLLLQTDGKVYGYLALVGGKYYLFTPDSSPILVHRSDDEPASFPDTP